MSTSYISENVSKIRLLCEFCCSSPHWQIKIDIDWKSIYSKFYKTKGNKSFEGNITVTTFNCEVEIVFSRKQQSKIQRGNYFLFSTAFIVGSFWSQLIDGSLESPWLLLLAYCPKILGGGRDQWIVLLLFYECSFNGGLPWGGRDAQTLPYAKEFIWTSCTQRQCGCKSFGY